MSLRLDLITVSLIISGEISPDPVLAAPGLLRFLYVSLRQEMAIRGLRLFLQCKPEAGNVDLELTTIPEI